MKDFLQVTPFLETPREDSLSDRTLVLDVSHPLIPKTKEAVSGTTALFRIYLIFFKHLRVHSKKNTVLMYMVPCNKNTKFKT